MPMACHRRGIKIRKALKTKKKRKDSKHSSCLDCGQAAELGTIPVANATCYTGGEYRRS